MEVKKILFNSWNGAFFQKGGGEVQLLQTKEALEECGYSVDLFNMWSPQLGIDILHQFSIEAGVEHVVKKYKSLGYKIALSTIMWHPPAKDSPEFNRVKSILDNSDIYLTNSEMESNILSNHFQIDLKKFHKTRNSISSNYFQVGNPEIFENKFGIKGEFVLSVANIDRRKNTDNLIAACKALGLRLVTIGHVKDTNYFHEFKSSYQYYTHLGPIEDEEMLKSAYSACSIYALPSYCETPGIAALEAASQGAKIVITNEGCAQEYFGHMAEYVSPYDLSSIICGLEKAMNNRIYPELSKFVQENYRWNITAHEVVEGYKKITT